MTSSPKGIVVSIFVDLAVIVAIAITIHFIRKLNERQELKHARMQEPP